MSPIVKVDVYVYGNDTPCCQCDDAGPVSYGTAAGESDPTAAPPVTPPAPTNAAGFNPAPLIALVPQILVALLQSFGLQK